MPNQYTKADQEGRDKPKGSNQFTTGKREHMDDAARDKLRAERAAHVAERIMNNSKSSTDQKLAAAKILLPYGKSTLASIESRQIDEPASEDEIMAQLRSLLSDPGARAQIQAMLNGSPAPVAEQQSTATSDPDVSMAA